MRAARAIRPRDLLEEIAPADSRAIDAAIAAAKGRAKSEATKLMPRQAAVAERTLYEMVEAVADHDKLIQAHERQIAKLNSVSAPLRVRAAMARDLQTGKADLTRLSKWLKRTQGELSSDPVARKNEDDALFALYDAVQRRQNLLTSLGPRAGKPKKRGAPGVPHHYYWQALRVIEAFSAMGTSRAGAAESVAKCLNALLAPHQKTVSGKTVLVWLRQHGFLPPLLKARPKP
jgi:hypothetical protein